MARKLRALTQAIDGHLALRFGTLDALKGRPALAVPADHPAIRAAFLQGEALLTRCFFEECQSHGLRDPASQMLIWDRLIARRHLFVELCERSQLNKYSRYLLPQSEGQEYKERCFRLFCLFLYDMAVTGQGAEALWREVQRLYTSMVVQD